MQLEEEQQVTDNTDLVKINFRLEQDEDGYPPVAVESLWARRGGDAQTFTVDNVPFFARDATLGDTVAGEIDGDGNLWFVRTLSRSENSLIRVTFFDKGCVDSVTASLEAMGCPTEYEKPHNLLAASVPPSVSLAVVQRYLQAETNAGRIDYEEAILRQ
jgi:hypothetical protein